MESPQKLFHIWGWVPDIDDVWNEWTSFKSTHNSCGQIEEIRKETDKISKIFNNYAHNYTVQLFYEAYDKSNPGLTWVRHNTTEHTPDDSTSDFAEVMKQFQSNDSFVAKKVSL